MKRVRLALLLFFLVFLALSVYIFQYNFLDIFPESIKKTELPEPELDDPYLHKRQKLFSVLERQETFWTKRIEASENKNYYLVVSLLDSSLWLDINGITVHEGKITNYALSPDLMARRQLQEIHAWIKADYTMQEQWATIPKHPIRTKDISEGRTNLDSLDFRPSAIDSTDIFVIFKYNNNLNLGIRQGEPLQRKTAVLRKQILLEADSDVLPAVSTDSLTYGELLAGDWVSITTTSEDIIALYRALDPASLLIIGI